jgi:hypothetical protein
MDAGDVLLDLFADLREPLASEFGTRLTLTAEADAFALRVRGSAGAGDGSPPTFVLTIRPGAGAFRVGYRPRGEGSPEPRTERVAYGTPALRRQLFRTVMGYVEAERKRLIDYRSRQP